MNRNTFDESEVDTPFSQASFDFRPGGNDLGDRSYVIYDLDDSSNNTPFSPASFVYKSGKDLDSRHRIHYQLDTPSSEASLTNGNFNHRMEKDAGSKRTQRDSSSGMVEYSSSFAYQNYKNKHKHQPKNPNLDIDSRQRIQNFRVKSYSDSDDSYDETRDIGMISANDRQSRRPLINRPTSITFDGGIYSTAADARNAVINPPSASNTEIRRKSTQKRPRSHSGNNI